MHVGARPATSYCWPTFDGEAEASGLPGLVVDTDLRWRIVTALAAGGQIDAYDADTPFIDAEAQRDPTAAGRRHAAAAAAARPQAEVKHRAWREVIEDDTLPNITARPSSAGSVHRQGPQKPSARALHQALLETISSVWERRSSEVAQTVVVGLYPSWDISTSALETASWFLDGLHVPPALRRLVPRGTGRRGTLLRARAFDES